MIDPTTKTKAKTYKGEGIMKLSTSTFMISKVEAPLNHYLATAYLLCRVVDNFEDCLFLCHLGTHLRALWYNLGCAHDHGI